MTVIYQTYSIGEADIKVYVTHHKAEADIWVYLAPSRGLACKEAVWFITKHKTKSQKKIFFGARGTSNVIVYFTNCFGSAGWRKSHRLTGHL